MSISQKKVGLYGGTFDPIHNGHIGMALSLMESHNLDEVFFVPTWVSPLKKGDECTSAFHRVQMLQWALEGVPRCSILLDEVERQQISYTIDTLLHFKEKLEKGVTLYLLLGEDCVSKLHQWKRVDEVVQLAQLLVARRIHVKDKEILTSLPSNVKLQSAVRLGLTQTPLFDVSGSLIRQRVRSGLYCGHLTDRRVWHYIQKNQLYI